MCELRDTACTFQKSGADRRHNRSATRAQSHVDDGHNVNNNMGRSALFSESEAGWQTAQSEGTNMHGDGDGIASSGVGERSLGATIVSQEVVI